MSSIYYKVIFKGTKSNEENELDSLSLTFKNLISGKYLTIPPQFIIELKKLTERSHNILSIQNIDEVIHIGTGQTRDVFNYYFIVLFTMKETEKKLGYLIGNKKKLGDVLIGIWPFNEQPTEITPEGVHEEFVNLIKKPHEYSNITLITA